ncbi:leucyl aminopeptidase family protein [Aeromonas sp. 603079]|uniref:leucyl aminopeptidase family protein n=1 Tax=unclassified Aeromonas TaxID=257493 RepID=UPI003A3A9B18
MLDASVTLWSTPLPATAHLLLWQGGAHGYREQSVLQPIAALLVELNGRQSTTLDVGLAGLCQRLTWLAADHQTLLEPAGLREMTDALIRVVPGDGTGCVALDITPFSLEKPAQRTALRHCIVTLQNQFYQLPLLGYRSAPSHAEPALRLLAAPEQHPLAEALLKECCAISYGMRLARRMADRPSQDCTPVSVADELASYAAQHDEVSCEILDEEAIRTLGLGALHAVGKGSLNPPRLILLRYRGGGDAQPYAIVGKGVTFDSGGLWLKEGEGMRTMKYDMCGAAVVFGLIDTVRRLTLPLNLDAVLVLAENMPTDRAMRPGDVVTTYAGHTVEIINTDAEGRLVLADGIAFADRQLSPRCIIDVATLTGAVVKALGYDISGLMSNDPALGSALTRAAESSRDRLWALPFDDSFEPQIKSYIADFTNTPPNNAAIAVSAGYFLSKFCGNRPWAHLDVSGTALRRGDYTQASGRPIPLLTEFLIQQIAPALNG